MGNRAFGAVNAWINLLVRGTAFLNVRTPGRARLLPRQVRRHAVAMLGDAPKASPHLREIDRALRSTLNDRPLLVIYGE